MREVELTMWSLEMLDPRELKPATLRSHDIAVQQAEIPSPEFSRFLYTAVGGPWYWLDRLRWSYEDWERYLARPSVETWVAYLQGTPAGYFELEYQQDTGSVELAQFGLLPHFIGQRLGGHLLTQATQRARAMSPRRVWARTFSLDGPHALANYKARGFYLFDTLTGVATVPDGPPGPWPRALTN
jgi:GNAT superfamily N-acetyltransferase